MGDYLKLHRGYAAALYQKIISSTGTPVTLLDIATGPGTVVLGLKSHISEAIGIDADEEMISEANRLAEENIVFFNKTFESFDIEKQFDLVTIAQSFEHLSPTSFKKISRYVRPGGALAIFWKYPDPKSAASKIYPREDMAMKLGEHQLITRLSPFQLGLETYGEFKTEESYKAEDWLRTLPISESERESLREKTPKYVTETFINYLWLFRKD
jgi:ubiquinone/menaquinone biosynthesis C-methylase UbiE